MTNEKPDQAYTVRVRSRGGAGHNAMWQWEVYAAGNALPIEKGLYKGSEARAYQTAQAAMARLSERRARTPQ
ncbi:MULTISPECIES: hypothetical protein [Methylocystis]|uniref:hypothetical protein n=1 Tax=Methylocystis TaxID=133 RepID=UPI0024B969BF|nr:MULTISPECIES: hypothetical protein [Methylocystis]MDJ0447505.1 hypothetical protein [Methylocystis sp. JR02]